MSKFLQDLLALREEDDAVQASDMKVDDQVHAQLDQEAEEDDVDAQCFGLEMEDGKVVKVYVKQEDAEAFEEALSTKLGEEDDIKAALDALEKDFEIIKIVWPDEDEDGDGEGDDEGDEEDDGSDSLNSEVDYDDSEDDAKKEEVAAPVLSYGQRFAQKLSEVKWSNDEHDEYKGASKDDESDEEASDEEGEQSTEPAGKESTPSSKWKVEKDEDGGMVISNDRFSMELDADEALDLVNKISDKKIARFKDEHGKIVYVFTPRGSEFILKTPQFQGGFRIPADVLTQITDSED